MKIFTLVLAVCLIAGDADAQQFSWQFTVLEGEYLRNFFNDIQTAPVIVRQVPIHEDDSDSGRIYTIPNKSLQLNSLSMLSAGVGPRLQLGKVSVKGTMLFNYITSPQAVPDRKNVGELNYYGSGRTQGAALVFYGAAGQTGWRRPGFAAEVAFTPGNRNGIRLLAGYKFTPFQLVFKNGWDRYDSFEGNTHFVLSDNRLHSPYAGIGIGPLAVMVGPVYHRYVATELGRTVNLTYPNTKFIRVGLGLSTDW